MKKNSLTSELAKGLTSGCSMITHESPYFIPACTSPAAGDLRHIYSTPKPAGNLQLIHSTLVLWMSYTCLQLLVTRQTPASTMQARN